MNAYLRRWIGVGLCTGIALRLVFLARPPQLSDSETPLNPPISGERPEEPSLPDSGKATEMPPLVALSDTPTTLQDLLRLVVEILDDPTDANAEARKGM